MREDMAFLAKTSFIKFEDETLAICLRNELINKNRADQLSLLKT